MQYDIVPDDALLIYFHTRIYGYVVPDPYFRADISLREYLAVVADHGAGIDHGEVAHIAILSQTCRWVDSGSFADTGPAGFVGDIQFEELCECAVCILDADHRCRDGLFGFETPVYDHHRRAGGIDVMFVFWVCEEREGSLMAFGNLGECVYGSRLVSYDLAADSSGDHFSGKFHIQKVFVLKRSIVTEASGWFKGIFSDRPLRAETVPDRRRSVPTRG